MLAKLGKSAIDLGMVVRNTDACVEFYGDLLGMELEGELDVLGVHMHRFVCGDTIVKLVTLAETPEAANPPGGFTGGTGIRYWTITVENLEEISDRCQSAGVPIPMPINEARPGVRMMVVEDPDGNWLEFIQHV